MCAHVSTAVTRLVPCVTHFIGTVSKTGNYLARYYYSYFTGKDAEDQRGSINCPRSLRLISGRSRSRPVCLYLPCRPADLPLKQCRVCAGICQCFCYREEGQRTGVQLACHSPARCARKPIAWHGLSRKGSSFIAKSTNKETGVSAQNCLPDPGFQHQASPDSRPERVLACRVWLRPGPSVLCACVRACGGGAGGETLVLGVICNISSYAYALCCFVPLSLKNN